MNVAVSFYFRFYDQGFTENWYLAGVTSPVANIARDLANFVGPAACAFRHPSCTLQAIRVRDVANNRDGALIKLGLGNNGSIAGTNTPDVTNVALRYNLAGDNGSNRRIWLRGLNDALTKRVSLTGNTDASGMDANVNLYFTLMRQAKAAIRKQTPPPNSTPPAANDWRQVKAFLAHATNPKWTTCKVLQGATTPPDVGRTVYFRGLPNPGMLYLRGAFKVLEKDDTAGTFTLPGQFRGTGEVSAADCSVRYLSYTYEAIQAWGSPELVTHKTGRPISSARGRRSPVIRRQLTRAG